MKRTFWAALLMLISSGTLVSEVRAEKWVYVNSYGEFTTYLDADSISVSGNRRSFWYKSVYPFEQRAPDADIPYIERFVQSMVNCGEGTYSDLWWVYYNSRGRQAGSNGYIGAPKLQLAIPGTHADDRLKIACRTVPPAIAKSPSPPPISDDYDKWMSIGYSAYRKGDFNTALINFGRALQERPGDQTASNAYLNSNNQLAKKKPKQIKANNFTTEDLKEFMGSGKIETAEGETQVFFDEVSNKIKYEAKTPYPVSGTILVDELSRELLVGRFYDNILNGYGCTGRISISSTSGEPNFMSWQIDKAISQTAKCPDLGQKFSLKVSRFFYPLTSENLEVAPSPDYFPTHYDCPGRRPALRVSWACVKGKWHNLIAE